ncbi:MAG: hypothetical protein GEV08_00545 [Acidimicrobiia bacterium]|nr:hypothetical protein [Acidimicrobiia bacterium]
MATRHIVVVGLMATGKSTVGRAVAQHLGLPFVDNDELLEARCGMTAAEIQEAGGRVELHRLEAEVLGTALRREERSVITAAASVIEASTARRALQDHLVVWLQASAPCSSVESRPERQEATITALTRARTWRKCSRTTLPGATRSSPRSPTSRSTPRRPAPSRSSPRWSAPSPADRHPAALTPLPSRRSSVARDEPHRAGHAGAGDAAIAVRHLGQVLLVVIFGVVELRRRADLRGDLAVAGTP